MVSILDQMRLWNKNVNSTWQTASLKYTELPDKCRQTGCERNIVGIYKHRRYSSTAVRELREIVETLELSVKPVNIMD